MDEEEAVDLGGQYIIGVKLLKGEVFGLSNYCWTLSMTLFCMEVQFKLCRLCPLNFVDVGKSI